MDILLFAIEVQEARDVRDGLVLGWQRGEKSGRIAPESDLPSRGGGAGKEEEEGKDEDFRRASHFRREQKVTGQALFAGQTMLPRHHEKKHVDYVHQPINSIDSIFVVTQVALLAENEGQINNVIQNNFVNRKIPMDVADQKEARGQVTDDTSSDLVDDVT